MAKKNKEHIALQGCIDCKHNQGENERFHYMWYCSCLGYYVVFGLMYCKAEKLDKGKFESKVKNKSPI